MVEPHPVIQMVFIFLTFYGKPGTHDADNLDNTIFALWNDYIMTQQLLIGQYVQLWNSATKILTIGWYNIRSFNNTADNTEKLTLRFNLISMTTLFESCMEILEISFLGILTIMHLLVFPKTSLVQQALKIFPCVKEKITSNFTFSR